MSCDDGFVSVDPVEVSHILLTQAFDVLHLVGTKVMVPLALVAVHAVILQEVKADVELGAGGGVCAGAMWTVAFVVVKADLEERAANRQL